VRRLSALFALLVGAVLVTRPLVHGVAGAAVLGFWAVVLGQVVAPGVLLARGARLADPADRLQLLVQGASIGLALQGLAVLAGRALGLSALPTLVAVAACLSGLALGRHSAGEPAPSDAPPPASTGASIATLAVAMIAAVLLPLASTARPSDPIPFDILFHGGNAAELRHRWPLEDPRVAGVPLHYHLLAYALPVAVADLASTPVADTLFTLAPLFWLVLLALQLQSVGRVVFGNARIGAAAAAVVLFHADSGTVLGLGNGAFNSYLSTGLYGSPTTLLGFVLVCGFTLALHAWIERGERPQLGALGLLAAAASSAKTTVLPPLWAALALSGLVSAWRGRAVEARRFAVALLVAALAGAPLTLWQNLGHESYSTMARFGLAAAFSSSSFARAVAAFSTEAVSGLRAAPVFLLWLLGYFGLSGVAASLWLFRQRRSLSSLQAWALFVLAAGLAASLLLDAPGLSQLFFVYNGQLLLALFAGAALVEAWRRPRRASEWATLAVLALALAPTLEHLGSALPAVLRADADATAYQPRPVERDYAAGLAWLRAHASRDAVVWADNSSLLLSALGEVRLFYENGAYSARAWRVAEGQEPWPERVELQERLLRRPDAATLAEARRATGPGRRLLVVADSVQSSVEEGVVGARLGAVPRRRLFPESLFDLLFVNGAMQVYEARP